MADTPTQSENQKNIDFENWPRRSQYALFKDFASPHVGITARIDVTGIMAAKQDQAIAPFNSMLYCLMTATNAVPELRTRFRENDLYIQPTEHLAEHLGKHQEDQRVIEHSLVHPSVTVPIENDRFAFCEIDFDPVWSTFNQNCEQAIAAGKAQEKLTEKTSDTDHWVFMSCLPWLDFTEMRHPLKGPADCIPRIAWGKFSLSPTPASPYSDREDSNPIWTAPVNLTAHHALVDGLHIARFFQKLEHSAQNFPEIVQV